MKSNLRLILLVLGIALISAGTTGTIISSIHREAAKEKATELIDVLIDKADAPFELGTVEYKEWKEFQRNTRVDLISAETYRTNSMSSIILAVGIGLSFAMAGTMIQKRINDNKAVQATSASARRLT